MHLSGVELVRLIESLGGRFERVDERSFEVVGLELESGLRAEIERQAQGILQTLADRDQPPVPAVQSINPRELPRRSRSSGRMERAVRRALARRGLGK